ncbi:MAG: phosphate ABC transporter substrate-binding protein PstS [Candidatus Nanopelagicales bacterium]
MTISRTARLAAVAVAGVLALAACGSDGGSPAASSGNANCVSGSLKASGSSAQKNAMAEWVNGYQTECPAATIDYQANGSGAGIQDFINKQTAFAGSDSALKDADKTAADARCAAGPAIDIPMVGGAIVAAYNVAGVDKLILTSDLLAGIFGSTITTWNDPKIAAANPGVTLPAATIAQFHRSDSSGTTDNFTKFIAGTSSTWTFGNAKEWKAPGGQGAKGSDGIAAAVKSTPNSIGYVELSFAQDAKVSAAWIDNGSGTPVEPTSANAAKTIETATIKGTGNDLALSIDYKTTAGYPAVLVTYEITCEKGLDPALVDLTKSFLTYAASDTAQDKLTELGYVPITGELLTKVRTAVSSISA